MGVGKVSDADFEAQVLKATEPVVVDFWAEWCGPSRMIAPALEEIAGTLNGKVKIVKLNVDESPKTASKYGVMSIPTLMIFKGGEMASRQVGAAPKQKLGLVVGGTCLPHERATVRPGVQRRRPSHIARGAGKHLPQPLAPWHHI